jgi:HEAT repeat protein
MERLQSPRGQMREPHTDFVLWDADPGRCVAARELGKLRDPAALSALIGATEDPNTPLRLEAARALGELGSPHAAPALIPLLGDPGYAEGSTVRSAAADALRTLGEGLLVDGFLTALRREDRDASRLFGAYPGAFKEALIRALNGRIQSEVGHAARALMQLGAVEALPDLRRTASRLRMHRPSDPVCRQMVDEAIGRLEGQAALPRPAGRPASEVSPDLPLPASRRDPEPRNLPRPSEPDGSPG